MVKILRYLLILFVLVGLPVFSWYFLNKGTSMRKDAMASLQVKEQVPSFQTLTDDDSTFTKQNLIGKRWFVFLMPTQLDSGKSLSVVTQIYELAKDDFHPYFLTLIGFNQSISTVDIIEPLLKKLDRKYWKNAFIAEEHFDNFTKEVFKLDPIVPSVVLLDEKAQIRNTYPINNDESIKKLVREYPVFLSLK